MAGGAQGLLAPGQLEIVLDHPRHQVLEADAGAPAGRRRDACRITLQEIDFGEEHQLVFELRPAHDPTKAYGFVNCVISLKDLSASIWTWYRDGNKWAVKKIISIPAEAADPDDLPPLLKGFKAVPPLVVIVASAETIN